MICVAIAKRKTKKKLRRGVVISKIAVGLIEVLWWGGRWWVGWCGGGSPCPIARSTSPVASCWCGGGRGSL